MAFALRSLRREPAKIDCLWLRRTDQESELLDRNLEGFLEALKLETSLRRHKTVDWLLPRREPWLRMHDKWDRILSKSPTVVQRASLLSRSYIYGNMARRRVKRGAKLLSTARYVVTDRLHGHILCVLLGIPHVCVDNAYGKIGSFFETWSESCPQAAYAESIETAVKKLRFLSST
jgi:pyruvyl transferase EpsO